MADDEKQSIVTLHRTTDMGSRGPLPKKRARIAEWVRRKIARGEIAPGDPLPSREWFVRNFSPNPRTVQEAFDELKRDGLIETVRGHATRVARRLPFENRYLLLTKARTEDAGSNLFAPALAAAARELECARGVTVDVKQLSDVAEMSPEYVHALESVRRQQYAGVILQETNDAPDVEGMANIDDVPIAYFGRRGLVTQGNLARCFNQDAAENGIVSYSELFRRHCDDIVAARAESVAVFAPLVTDGWWLEKRHRDIAAEHGLEIARCCYHEVNMRNWHPRQFRRLAALVLSQPWVGPRTAFVLEDDNMLAHFERVLAERSGKGGASGIVVCCHANSPNLPKTGLRVNFHGIDCTATLASALDYADACRRHDRHPPTPRVVMF